MSEDCKFREDSGFWWFTLETKVFDCEEFKTRSLYNL